MFNLSIALNTSLGLNKYTLVLTETNANAIPSLILFAKTVARNESVAS